MDQAVLASLIPLCSKAWPIMCSKTDTLCWGPQWKETRLPRTPLCLRDQWIRIPIKVADLKGESAFLNPLPSPPLLDQPPHADRVVLPAALNPVALQAR